MKKILTFILLTCMVLSFAACGKTEITAEEIYDAGRVEVMLQNHQSVYVHRTMDDIAFVDSYLTEEYSFVEFPDGESSSAQFMTDSASYAYMGGSYLRYLFVTPEGVTNDFTGDRAELCATEFAADILVETMESVSEQDGRIVVNSVLGEEALAELASAGVVSGKSAYVLDAKTKELISVATDYVLEDGNFGMAAEFTYDAEVPEMLETFLKFEEQTDDLRKVTIVCNPGAAAEVSRDFLIPKGLVIGFTYGDEYEGKVAFYTDAACTQAYDPYVNTDADLTVYITWGNT